VGSDGGRGVGGGLSPWRGDEQPLAAQFQTGRIFVFDGQAEPAREAVADRDLYLVLGADHKPARHVTGDFNLRDIFRAAIIKVGDEEQDQIVNDQAPFDSRRSPGEDQGQDPEREKNEEAARENHGLGRTAGQLKRTGAQRGTSTEVTISSRIESGVTPSISASERSKMRWRSAGCAMSRASSGVTKSRPRIAASALLASSIATDARGLAPQSRLGCSRVRRTRFNR